MPPNPHYESVRAKLVTKKEKRLQKPWCLRCGDVPRGERTKACSVYGTLYKRHIWEALDKMLSV